MLNLSLVTSEHICKLGLWTRVKVVKTGTKSSIHLKRWTQRQRQQQAASQQATQRTIFQRCFLAQSMQEQLMCSGISLNTKTPATLTNNDSIHRVQCFDTDRAARWMHFLFESVYSFGFLSCLIVIILSNASFRTVQVLVLTVFIVVSVSKWCLK